MLQFKFTFLKEKFMAHYKGFMAEHVTKLLVSFLLFLSELLMQAFRRK